MTLTNTPLSTFDGVGGDGVVPLTILFRWFKLLREEIDGVERYVDSTLALNGRSKWPLAANDGSVTLYELVNLYGKPILAVHQRDLVRVERDLMAKFQLSPERLAATLKKAEIFAISDPQRKMLRFANKVAVRKRLSADKAERRTRREAAAAAAAAAAATSGQAKAEVRSDASTSCTNTPQPVVEPSDAKAASRTAGKKRTASVVIASVSPPAPAPTPPGDTKTTTHAPSQTQPLGSIATVSQPPTKRKRPPLPGPSHSSPPALEAAVSPRPPPPPPPAELALSRPTTPAPPVPTSTYADAEKIAAAKHVASRAFELETLRLAHEAAVRNGAGAFLALDVEAWEFDHDLLLEFGWSIVEYVKDEVTGKVSERRETQHVVVKENARRRNRKFAPDARDHFDFGRSITLPQQSIFHLLSGLFSALSANQPLFLVFHDPRMDLSALRRLGFDTTREFQNDLRKLSTFHTTSGGEHGVWVVDTQALFSGWLKRKSQIGLERACKEIELATKRLHNAGNDARYTLDLFEHMMDRTNSPAPASSLVKFLDERAAAEAANRLKRLETGAQILREKFEQKNLRAGIATTSTT
ncbi:hypothetical protein JCM3774_002058 [Rhodotorula dairenensis]